MGGTGGVHVSNKPLGKCRVAFGRMLNVHVRVTRVRLWGCRMIERFIYIFFSFFVFFFISI